MSSIHATLAVSAAVVVLAAAVVMAAGAVGGPSEEGLVVVGAILGIVALVFWYKAFRRAEGEG